MAHKKIAHIVPHTHWDREWRYPIWKNRLVLVEFMDQLLELLDSRPDYRQFIMDGQSVMIEDYLEMRPEKADKVKAYIKQGRITCGPWYTLPDLYPIDGECLVRNLLKGFRVSREYGACMDIGYTSFGWGQTAQFPQIFAGFGIDFVITAKRVDEARAPESEFWWEAPDGTRVLTTRLGAGGRALFFVTAVLQSKYDTCNDDYYHFAWNKSGAVYHKANGEDSHEDYFKIDEHETFYPHRVRPAIEACWEGTEATVLKTERLLLAGCDFSGPIPELGKIIEEANRAFDDKEFKHSSLQEYVASFKAQAGLQALRTIKGELRDGPSSACSGNALATRLYIKQLNKKVQNLLIHKAEPLSSAVAILGREYPASFLNKAWNYLLKAQPHDSINGVTQDKTAEDNMYRLNQALELAGVTYEKALAELLGLADLSDYGEEDLLLFVVNPLPFPVSDIVRLSVDLPRELKCWDFRVLDGEGGEAGVQWISKREEVVPVHDLHARPWPFYIDRHDVWLETGTVPAGGFRVFKVVPANRFARSFISGPAYQRMTDGQEISRTHNTLENEYLSIEVNPNGTLKMTDKERGRVFDGLHYFEETGEVGDYWINLPPFENRTFTSHGAAARIWCADNGRLSATLGIEIKMEVPAYGLKPQSFFGSGSGRSAEPAVMAITTHVTLKKGSRRLEVKVTVDNTARDHRVRVMYPTGIKTHTACAAGHFTVDKRPVMPLEGQSRQYYVDMQTLPQQSFVDVSDGKEGIAFINNCLTEYELKNDGKSTLALTLLRGVRNIICTEMRALGRFPGQKGGQCLGVREYEYAIFPHAGDWEAARVFKEAKAFNVPLTVLQTSAHKKGGIPQGTSLFAIASEELVLSAFKKAEDRDTYIVRLFNPTDRTIESSIRTYSAVKKAYLVNLNEEREKPAELMDGAVAVKAGGNKIITVELEF